MNTTQLQEQKEKLEIKTLKYSNKLRRLYQKGNLEKYKGECDNIMNKFNNASKELKEINGKLEQLKNEANGK